MELPESTKKKLDETRKTMEVFTLFVTILGIAAYMITKAGPWFVYWAERGEISTAWVTLGFMIIAVLLVTLGSGGVSGLRPTSGLDLHSRWITGS